MVAPNEFNNAKNALLRHYSSLQTSHGAVMIGFTVALFTFVQIVPITTLTRELESCSCIIGLKLFLYSIGIYFLVSLVIYTLFRIGYYGLLTSVLINLSPKSIETNEKDERPIHGKINYSCVKSCRESAERLLYLLPPGYFVRKFIWKGIISCFGLAVVPTLIILFLLF